MRKADGPMSTPRRPPPRSRGTPMMWTDFIKLKLKSQKAKVKVLLFTFNFPSGREGGGAAVRNAVGNTCAAEAATGDIQTGVAGQSGFDGGHTLQVTDLVLRVRALPAVDPRQQRWGADPEER